VGVDRAGKSARNGTKMMSKLPDRCGARGVGGLRPLDRTCADVTACAGPDRDGTKEADLGEKKGGNRKVKDPNRRNNPVQVRVF